MAEGWARHYQLNARSAGIEAHGQNPRAIAAMAEAGIDISGQESTRLEPSMLDWAEYVVTVCGHADENCPVLPPATRKDHWPLSDPAKATGDDEQTQTVFREIRDAIHQRVADLANSIRQETTEKEKRK